jgi:hypothetical protein
LEFLWSLELGIWSFQDTIPGLRALTILARDNPSELVTIAR